MRHLNKMVGLVIGVILVMTAACSGGGTSSGNGGDGGGGPAAEAVGCPTVGESASDRENYDPDAILRYGSVPASSLDPIRLVEANEITVLKTIFDPLVKLDAEGLPQPGLATSWKMVGDDVMEFKLRKGVEFSDGTPFDADAVKFNIERAINDKESTIAPTLSDVKAVDVVDDYTVRFTLDPAKPAAFPITLADRAGLMASPTAVKKAGSSTAFSAAPVGAGPYVVEGEWFAREKLSVRAWDGYWNADKRYLGGIDFIETSTDATVGALKAGDLDMQYVDDAQVGALCEDGDVRVIISPTNEVRVLIYNQSMEPFDDLKVREALHYAIDRQAVADVMTNGTAEAATQFFPKGSQAYSEELADRYPYDPEKARALLEEAGYPDGVSFKAEIGGSFTSYVRMGEIVQAQLKESGIDMELAMIDAAQMLSRLYGIGGTEAKTAASPLAFPPTFQLSSRFADRFYANGQYNPSGVEIEGVRELVEKADATTDAAKRSSLLQEAAKLVADAAAQGVPLYFVPGNTGYAPYVGGVERGATRSNISFEGLYITKDRVPVGTKAGS